MQKIAAFLLAIGLFVSFFSCQNINTAAAVGLSGRQLRYVAYVGFNYQDTAKARSNSYTDSLHLVALEAYIEQLNTKNYGVEYQLKSYQCDFKEDTIQSLYSAIAADTNVVLVIDNTWGRHMRHAAEIIKGRLPVIATNADQNQLDFGNNAVFLDPNDPQPFYLIKFIKEVLKAKRIGFITETDYLLHKRFSAHIKGNNLPCDTLVQLL